MISLEEGKEPVRKTINYYGPINIWSFDRTTQLFLYRLQVERLHGRFESVLILVLIIITGHCISHPFSTIVNTKDGSLFTNCHLIN